MTRATILGVDPGTHRTGVVWLNAEDGTLAGWRLLRAPRGNLLAHERMKLLCDEVAAVLALTGASVVVLERQPGGVRHKKPAEQLGTLGGDLHTLARRAGAKVVWYTPSEWRAITVGRGDVDKDTSARWLRVAYPMLAVIPPDMALDVLDAAGLALAYWERERDPRVTAIADAAKRGELTRLALARKYA